MEIIYFITVKDLLLADFGLVIGVIISILSYKHIELAYMNILRICKKKGENFLCNSGQDETNRH